MKLTEKILNQLPFHEIVEYVEKRINTPQSVTAGKRVGAQPGSRKATNAKLRAMFQIEVKN